MIETKDVVAKSLEIYPIYSTCPLCGREGEQRVFVIYEPDKVKDCLRARHSYYNDSSEPVSEILNGSDITKNRLYSYFIEREEDRVIRLVCSKCNTMYAPDPLQEHSIYKEQGWGLYFRTNRPEKFPIKLHKFKMAVGIKCDSCKEEVTSPYYIMERNGKIEHYCGTSPNRCGPNAWHGEIELTKFMKNLQKEEERARRPGKPGYKCNICGFETTSKREIEKHIKEKHGHVLKEISEKNKKIQGKTAREFKNTIYELLKLHQKEIEKHKREKHENASRGVLNEKDEQE